MPNRLPELLRQRALLQEHLAWLDREIAAEQGSPTAKSTSELKSVPTAVLSIPTARPAAPASTPTATTTPPPLPENPTDLDKIVAQYRRDPGSLTQDTRRGCLMIFWIGLATVLLISGIVYWLYARHLGRWW
ncbi:MAG: hypothetical protein QM715_00345 [Nibricoccus sp.]